MRFLYISVSRFLFVVLVLLICNCGSKSGNMSYEDQCVIRLPEPGMNCSLSVKCPPASARPDAQVKYDISGVPNLDTGNISEPDIGTPYLDMLYWQIMINCRETKLLEKYDGYLCKFTCSLNIKKVHEQEQFFLTEFCGSSQLNANNINMFCGWHELSHIRKGPGIPGGLF